MHGKPKLLLQIKEKLTYLHYSNRTKEVYLRWIKEFIVFNNKIHPLKLGADEVKNYLNYLATKRNISASTQNQAMQAILFMYKRLLIKILAG